MDEGSKLWDVAWSGSVLTYDRFVKAMEAWIPAAEPTSGFLGLPEESVAALKVGDRVRARDVDSLGKFRGLTFEITEVSEVSTGWYIATVLETGERGVHITAADQGVFWDLLEDRPTLPSMSFLPSCPSPGCAKLAAPEHVTYRTETRNVHSMFFGIPCMPTTKQVTIAKAKCWWCERQYEQECPE